MKSGTAAAPAANQPINSDECVNRILKAVQEKAIVPAEEKTRIEVTRALRNRFDLEVSKLQAAFDQRLTEVVAETEALAQLKLESTLASTRETLRAQILEEIKTAHQAKLDEADTLINKLKEDANTAASESVKERQLLYDRIAANERALDIARAACIERADEYAELQRQIDETRQSNAQLQLELQQAVAELNSHSAADGKDEGESAAHREIAAIVHSEVIRVLSQLEQIDKALSDPATEMGTEIRLKREQAELQAYLKGLRYSLGQVAVEASK
jgi:hypothetical protein